MRQRHVVRHSLQGKVMPEPSVRYTHPECMAEFYGLEILALIQEPGNAILDVSTPEDEVKQTLMVISPLDVVPTTQCFFCEGFVLGVPLDREIIKKLRWERRA